MASELEIRQKTVSRILRDHRAIFASLEVDQLELLEQLSDDLEENLKDQGAPLFAEEVIAGLTVLEMIDDAEDLEAMKRSMNILKLSLILRLDEAWKDRDKRFFID